MTDVFLVGQTVFVRVRLSDPSTGDPNDSTTQDPVDDPTVALTVYDPTGAAVDPSPSLTRESTGTYTATVQPDQDGYWHAVSDSSGAATGVGRYRFYASPILPP